MGHTSKKILLLASVLAMPPAIAQDAADDTAAANSADASRPTEQAQRESARPATEKQPSIADIEAQLTELQNTLDAQKKLIDAQKAQIEQQQTQLNNQQTHTLNSAQLLTDMQSQLDQLKSQGGPPSDESLAMQKQLQNLQEQVGEIPDDPSLMLADQNFPGAIRVPGTTAAYKIGGFVKAAVVNNFDPLVAQDRFIVGSIPVTSDDQKSVAAETSLTANQSRINFDYRQREEKRTLRAFIEADFFGTGDTLRLRHAFGQYSDLLAGKTWSAFYDAEAAPEEVDFEGINGHVLLRQTQVRYFPEIGKDLQLMVSLEDPQPQVTGGEGVSELPDLVASIRRTWFNRWHIKTAVLMRQIRATVSAGVDSNGQPCTPIAGTPAGQPDSNGCAAMATPGSSVKTNGWALTLSGKVKIPMTGENDNLLWQFNYGEGLGRYLTDLSSIVSLGTDGGQDAVVDPETGDFKPLPVFGGYLAYQHWWTRTSGLRSTFIVAMIDINNLDYQPANAYNQTQRAAGNLIWSPISSLDLGVEFLWGKRINKGAVGGISDATATQLQLEAKYRF
jgi:hypothetical protein